MIGGIVYLKMRQDQEAPSTAIWERNRGETLQMPYVLVINHKSV
jgi:hypothetical protein